MMSRRCEYGLRALVDLGLARESGTERLPVREISQRERIPPKFLEQILLQLRRAGYVRSRRGRDGGYALAKSARTIRVGSVVRLLDGPLAPLSCVSRTAYAPCSCPDEGECGLRRVILHARDALSRALDGYTIADAVEAERGERRRPPRRSGRRARTGGKRA